VLSHLHGLSAIGVAADRPQYTELHRDVKRNLSRFVNKFLDCIGLYRYAIRVQSMQTAKRFAFITPL
jgi:hypothetical protein